MSVVRINAMTMKDGHGEDFLHRFSARPHTIEHADGFEGFQVLRPLDDRSTWLVITQWRDSAAYESWYAGRPHRDPDSVTYAEGWELWAYEVVETASPASAA